ncbi:MAG: Ig-like domain-containing protein, partial [Nocardioides sp.]
MPFGGQLQRRRAALASWVALAVAVGGVVTYAVQADGYQSHKAELNDGGIWVTSKKDGSYGRINKPIGELDGAIFSRLDSNLDVVQDGSSVVGINLTDGIVVPLDPAQMRVGDDQEASIPGSPAVGMAGGSLAVLDSVSGKLWATREDPAVGLPAVAPLANQADPVATVGADAVLAVSLDGTVLAASSATGEVVTLHQSGEDGFAQATTDDLPGEKFSDAIALTAVGAVPVVLDAASGRLAVIGGAETEVPKGSVLQQPGPSASSVLVGAPDGLLSVDLATGKVTTVTGDVGGEPSNPVRLGDCEYGAWSGGTGSVVTVCGGGAATPQALDAQTSDLVFRVNRAQIVLNDRTSGNVWDIDSDKPTRLDNWDAFRLKSQDKNDDEDQNQQDQGDRRPPKAKNDSLGARPGRTTILHPLDNDTAPSGRLLAIRSVRAVSGAPGQLAISPDGQTVQVSLPGDAVGGTSFEYFIDDGRQSVSAHATVRVAIAASSAQNSEPELREGFQPRIWTVPSSGTVDIPVLSDWRDPHDGDPVSTVSAEPQNAAAGADARITAAGAVRFHAPAQAGLVKVAYDVTDGLGRPVTENLDFRVQDPNDLDGVPPVAEPDVIAGETGKPVVIAPLANDLPGADPNTPDAVLRLAGKLAQVPGAQVTTNLIKGTVTLRSDTAQTYFLDYQAAYGTAETATGKIRVDVRAPENPPLDPVAVPDTVTLFGQAASLVDVLANDVDPSGGLLSVQRADPVNDNQLDVAVVSGRWLRVSARQGALTPNPQLIRYTISNGRTSDVVGQVVVSQRPLPQDNTPVTQNDEVTVRAGSSQAIPVLDNDYSPSGGTLSLVSEGLGDQA